MRGCLGQTSKHLRRLVWANRVLLGVKSAWREGVALLGRRLGRRFGSDESRCARFMVEQITGKSSQVKVPIGVVLSALTLTRTSGRLPTSAIPVVFASNRIRPDKPRTLRIL